MSKKENQNVKQEKEACSCDANCSCNKESEYLEMAQRIQAEFDNYRKRSSDIVKTARLDGIIEAVTRFLPTIDSIEKAKEMIQDPKTLEGIEMISKEITNSLKALNIEKIEALGEKFNPNMHNVIAVKTDNSLEDGLILEVYQAGYKIMDKVIRYSQVVINKVQKNIEEGKEN